MMVVYLKRMQNANAGRGMRRTLFLHRYRKKRSRPNIVLLELMRYKPHAPILPAWDWADANVGGTAKRPSGPFGNGGQFSCKRGSSLAIISVGIY
jgi:hypothetical protein